MATFEEFIKGLDGKVVCVFIRGMSQVIREDEFGGFVGKIAVKDDYLELFASDNATALGIRYSDICVITELDHQCPNCAEPEEDFEINWDDLRNSLGE